MPSRTKPSSAPHSASSTAPSALHLPVAEALRRSETMGSLLDRLVASDRRLACISPVLTDDLRAAVKAGPLDDAGWSLLVAHASAAAKLRQLLPELNNTLLAAGWPAVPIRLRVQGRG